MKKDKYLLYGKFSFSVSLLFLSYSLLVLLECPAIGYEISFYSSTPLFFWIIAIVNLFNGVILLFFSLYKDVEKIWKLGFFEIIITSFSIISAYALRGYALYMGRGDVQSYVGMAKDITDYGVIFDYNPYPLFAILISQINQLTAISARNVSIYLPAIFYVMYLLFIYSWSKSFLISRKFVLASIIASTPIFFAWFSTSIYFMYLTTLTIPLFFFCLQNDNNINFKPLTVLLCLIYPYYHLIVASVIVTYLGILYVVRKKIAVSHGLMLVSLVGLTYWSVNQYTLLKNIEMIIQRVYDIFFMFTANTEVSSASIAAYYINSLGIMSAIKIYLLMGFDELSFYIFSILSCYYLIFYDKSRNSNGFLRNLICCFIGGSIFIAVIFSLFRIHAPTRLINLNWNMMLTPPLVGYLLYRFTLKRNLPKTLFILLVIFVSVITSIFSLYPSPVTMRPNEQITNSDIAGANWLISEKHPNLGIADIMTPMYRFADLIFGYKFRLDNEDLNMLKHQQVPDHFGVINNSYFSVDKNSYLVITKYDQLAYTETWEKIGRFNHADFENLKFIKNISKIYSNDEFSAFLIYKNYF